MPAIFGLDPNLARSGMKEKHLNKLRSRSGGTALAEASSKDVESRGSASQELGSGAQKALKARLVQKWPATFLEAT